MALIKCPECGHDVSSFANQCPHCGCPQNVFNRPTTSKAINIIQEQTPKSHAYNEFEIKDGVLVKYKGDNKDIVIPEGVTHIGEKAFYNCSFIESITIPKSLKSIGEKAFSGDTNYNNWVDHDSYNRIYRTNLSKINITDVAAWCNIDFGDGSIFRFGQGFNKGLCLYLNNERITNLVIPNGVTFISEFAFCKCALESVSIPRSIKKIGPHVFSEYLYDLDIHITDIASWCEIDFDWNGLDSKTKIHLYLNDVLVTDLIIPETITTIRKKAFYNCGDIKKITLPNSVTSIENCAFDGCYALKDVYITDLEAWCNIEHYWLNPLCHAENLYLNERLVTDLIIPNGVTSIGGFAFYNFKSVKIPNSVTSIKGHTFYNCKSLASITIPNSVTSIGDSAFSNCKSLTSITIPNSVTSIGDSAFYNCESLASVTIPNSVTSIGNSAFQNCKSLTSLTIPNSVTNIGFSSFNGCQKLRINTTNGSFAEKYANEENIPCRIKQYGKHNYF